MFFGSSSSSLAPTASVAASSGTVFVCLSTQLQLTVQTIINETSFMPLQLLIRSLGTCSAASEGRAKAKR
jgi:hypothetical protein